MSEDDEARAALLPEVLTVDEVAVFLRVNRKLVYTEIKRGKLHARKIGRIYRIHRDDVLNYLRQGRSPDRR